MTQDPDESTMMAMELRQQSLEKEMSVLKDTVWRLTGRVFVLESFLSEKFDELVVDFGLKLSMSAGGHANFLAQAMSAEASVSKLGSCNNNNNHHPHIVSLDEDQSEEMSIGGGEGENDDPSSPSITIDGQHHHHHNGNGGDKGHNHHGHGHHRGNNPNAVSIGLSSPSGLATAREGRQSHSRFLYKRDPTNERSSNTGDGDNYHSQSDFNVEEFVVFPHVPEFILGQEVQNGSSGALASSEDSNNSDCLPHHAHRPHELSHHNLLSPPPPPSSAPSNFSMRRNPRYKCIPCAKLFTSEWHLKAHLVKHSDSNLITINNNSSSEQGSPSGNLTQQVITVSPLGSATNNSDPDVKPFACVYCGKRFKKRQELTVHLRTHTGEKPYKCPVCDRGFSQSSSMKTHLRIHTGEKPFKCRFCKSSFTVMHNYKKHLQTAHQIDDFS